MNKMNAWVATAHGPYQDVLRWQEIDQPTIGDDQVLIKVAAAGVNFADMLSIAGTYQVRSEPPFVPGFEATGTVAAIGKDVDKVFVGQRVAGFAFRGAYGQYMALDQNMCFATDKSIPDEIAAGLTVTYHTSYVALVYRTQLQAGETLLVHGGSGGVGVTAIQIGKALGATVIATASSQNKLDVCTQNGADYVINYREEDFVERVKEITDGRGADVIFEQVGGETFSRSTSCIAFEGRIVIVGFTSGEIPAIKTNRIMVKNIAVTGINWPNYGLYKPEILARSQQALYGMYQAGKIQPVVDSVHPLSDLIEQLDRLKNRQAEGKIILKM